MSSYRGRTGPNFSEYLNNLNTLSPTYDPNSFGDELLDLGQDLSLFTNTDFTSMDDPAFNFELPTDQKNGGVAFDDYTGSGNQQQSMNVQSPTDSNHFYTTYNTLIQPAPVPQFNQIDAASQSQIAQGQSKKKADLNDSMLTAEERSRVAAEEDKRRRNTAASARFRVKKKQREQALEKTLKESQDKTAKLEAKITQLELENKWLKELITEKNGIQSKEEMAAAYQKYRKESEECEVKNEEPQHVTGVGTA